MGKKWLTETEAYNIITQCDVVRDTLANSPGDGIYQRFRTFPQYNLHCSPGILYMILRMTVITQIIVDK